MYTSLHPHTLLSYLHLQHLAIEACMLRIKCAHADPPPAIRAHSLRIPSDLLNVSFRAREHYQQTILLLHCMIVAV